VCRLSIVVPYDRDEAAFETTLVSVLENRPEFCEVIVSHDGQYQDPFDLGDEVRFVVAPSGDSMSLIRAAISASLGRIVHVMQGGVRATENWVDEPLSMFEQSDLGCVAPVIRDLTVGGKIVAAGWRDAGGRLQQPLANGSENPTRHQVASVQGAFLAASFWRRNVIEGLLEIPITTQQGAFDYVLATALQRAGWRCRLASSSDVIGSPKMLTPAIGTVKNWSAIQAFRSAVGKEKGAGAVFAGLLGTICNPTNLTSWLEFVGRVSAAFSTDAQAKEVVDEMLQICPAIGPNVASEKILKLPAANMHEGALRRAA
jgi:hypothetical protein